MTMNYVDRFDAAQGARTNRLPTDIREEWRERSPEPTPMRPPMRPPMRGGISPLTNVGGNYGTLPFVNNTTDYRKSTRPGWTGFGQPPVGVGNVGGNYGTLPFQPPLQLARDRIGTSRLAGSVGGNYQPPVGNWQDLQNPFEFPLQLARDRMPRLNWQNLQNPIDYVVPNVFRPSTYRALGDTLDPFQRRPMPTRPPTRYPTSGIPVEGF